MNILGGAVNDWPVKFSIFRGYIFLTVRVFGLTAVGAVAVPAGGITKFPLLVPIMLASFFHN